MRKATAFRGGANKTAPPCETLAIICYLATVPAEQLQRNITLQKILASRENNLQRPAKGGSTPAFACQRAAIAPVALLEFTTLILIIQLYLNLTVSKYAIAAEKPVCKIQFAPQMWATRPHLGSIFEKLLHRKTFYFACGSYLTTHLEKIFQEPFHKLQSLSTPQPNPTFHNSLFFSG